ncbi:MAG: hypothetical protein PHI88_00295 [Candidatus Pacebacteria bacterium]|nr:hypothetical protein [Candidatus Paceibacterota bacterium]
MKKFWIYFAIIMSVLLIGGIIITAVLGILDDIYAWAWVGLVMLLIAVLFIAAYGEYIISAIGLVDLYFFFAMIFNFQWKYFLYFLATSAILVLVAIIYVFLKEIGLVDFEEFFSSSEGKSSSGGSSGGSSGDSFIGSSKSRKEKEYCRKCGSFNHSTFAHGSHAEKSPSECRECGSQYHITLDHKECGVCESTEHDTSEHIPFSGKLEGD